MGNCCFPVRIQRRSSDIAPKQVTLLLVGLDNAGKTTIAKRLSEEPLDGITPTVGFSKVSLQDKGCRVTIYDLGGGPQIRDIWPRYYADVHGVIFVIDASDVHRMSECRQVLEGLLLHSCISGKPLLLLANKQDVDGALDEIDVVDRLNVERLVNRQKCPTLVELCSARHFSRKMDLGMNHGYKWLLRCISKDYPALNNRVLNDLAAQDELERVRRLQIEERVRKMRKEREMDENTRPRLKSADKSHQNGAVKLIDPAAIPGQVQDASGDSVLREIPRGYLKENHSANIPLAVSQSSEFFKRERDNPDILLIRNLDDKRSNKNFLLRPRSSGPRLSSGTRRRGPRRKSYQRNNKTAPSPMSDLRLEPIGPLPKVFEPSREDEAEDAPTVNGQLSVDGPRSVPGSRHASATASGQQRSTSSVEIPREVSKLGKLPPLKLSRGMPRPDEVLPF